VRDIGGCSSEDYNNPAIEEQGVGVIADAKSLKQLSNSGEASKKASTSEGVWCG
jgi:hypothetical protein